MIKRNIDQIPEEESAAESEVPSGRQKSKGLYHNDYAPRFRDSYNIYDKARAHMKELRKKV